MSSQWISPIGSVIGATIRRRSRFHRVIAGLAAVAVGLVVSGASAQFNPLSPNDECANATPIAADGVWSLADLTNATPSLLPPPPPGCNYPFQFRDVFYCWTATFNGIAIVDVGFNPLVSMMVYQGCGCPTAATQVLGCGNVVTLDVQCGQKYLIRVGAETWPLPIGPVGLRIIKEVGDDCTPPEGDCPNCCGAKPTYTDPFYTTNYTGQVAVMTSNDDSPQATGYPVVTIFNLACPPQPPTLGAEFQPVGGPPTTAFRYSKTDWTKQKMGSVFGLTLDAQGNIYAAHAGMYGVLAGSPITCFGTSNAIGNAGSTLPNTSTSVLKIPAGTGIPEVFVNLPGGSQNVTDPGLGNIHFDCDSQQFFISHFGDGRIYRVSAAGVILGWYNHSVDVIGAGSTPDSTAPYTTFMPLGMRVWAVQVHDGRLYYSVWGQNKDQFTPALVVGPTPNRVWSIALQPGVNGDFVAGSRQQELQPPAHPGNTYAPLAIGPFSAPISDISFSPTCRMLLAERDMSRDNCTLGHAARALEFGSMGGSWMPTNYRNGYGYEIGEIGPSVTGSNSAGGCDYDFAPVDQCTAGRLWVTGDALVYTTPSQRVYGLAGVPTNTPFSNLLSLFIDYNGDYSNGSFDKSKQGDVEIPCYLAEEPCLNVSNQKVFCPTDGGGGTPPHGGQEGPGCYTLTFSITNKTPFSVKYVTVPLHPTPSSPITINPNVINLLVQDGSLLDPGETTTVSFTVCGGLAGQSFSLPISLLTSTFDECCYDKIEVDLPECDCGQLRNQSFSQILCPEPGVVSFTFNFTLDNLSGFPASWAIFIPHKTETAYFAKDFFFLPPLPAGGSMPMSVQIVNAQQGSTFCFNVLLQNPNDSTTDCCCAFEKCITVPPCTSNPRLDADFNGDGVVGPGDLAVILSAWGNPGCGGSLPCPADLNHDGRVDAADLAILLGCWGKAPG